MPTRTEHDLWEILVARFGLSISLSETFFKAEAEKIATASFAMARRFHQGGRLLAFGSGACATDAQHISVEFVHPVIVGKRALPALALSNDNPTLSSQDTSVVGSSFVRQMNVLARPADIALGFSPDGSCQNTVEDLVAAKEMGLLTLGLTGSAGKLLQQSELDFCFVVPSRDLPTIQEVHETLYHILWEQVHVFFEHGGLLC